MEKNNVPHKKKIKQTKYARKELDQSQRSVE